MMNELFNNNRALSIIGILNNNLALFKAGFLNNKKVLSLEEEVLSQLDKEGFKASIYIDKNGVPVRYSLIERDEVALTLNSLIEYALNSSIKVSVESRIKLKGIDFELITFLCRGADFFNGKKVSYNGRCATVAGMYLGNEDQGRPVRFLLVYDDTKTKTQALMKNCTILY